MEIETVSILELRSYPLHSKGFEVPLNKVFDKKVLDKKVLDLV